MGFQDRSNMEKRMSEALTDFLRSLGFRITDIGYENLFDEEIRNILRRIYDDETVLFVRFMPDKFAYWNAKNIFLIEYKICNTPIYSDRRIKFLQKISGIKTLSKENVGAIETSAIQNYKKLSSIGVKILIIIYSKFHSRKLVANWIDNFRIIHQDKVKFGNGNASRTPFSNINLDEFIELKQFLIDEFEIKNSEIDKFYNRCLRKIEGEI